MHTHGSRDRKFGLFILQGKTDRLIAELEKKYSVSLASYAVPLAADAVVSVSVSSGDSAADDGSRASAESVSVSSSVAPIVAPDCSAGLESSLPAVGGPPKSTPPSASPPGVSQHSAPATAPASDSAVVSLRAELRRLRGQYDALRNEKDAEITAARRETRVLEDSMRDARKQQERMQGAAVERDAIANQRYAALATRTQELQSVLDAAHDESQEARVEANTRAEQLAESLETVHLLRWQLHMCLGHMGVQFDPYDEAKHAEISGEPLQCPSIPSTSESSSTSRASEDLVAEIALLRAVNAAGEEKIVSQAKVIEDMTATLCALRESAEATSGSGAALAAALAESKAALEVAQEELARERMGREVDQEEVRRLEGTVALAVATRREIQALGERERRVVEDAARKRIEETTAQILMEREDGASEACEAWDLERKNARQEVELMKLEMDSLSRAVVDLRNERNNLDDEVERLRAELTRAAEKIVGRMDTETKPT